MRFLPVVERELRVASRKRSTYWNRFFTASVVLLLCGWILWMDRGQSTEILAKALFYTIAGFTFLYSLLVGIQVTADSLSEEKREGTMGLLFLTDLRGGDVIMGKLFATSLNAYYRLLAVFPAMALPFLLGGMVWQEFARMILVLLVTALLSLCAGMLVSALSYHERRAMAGTVGLMALLLGAGPLAAWLWGHLAQPPSILWLSSIGFAAHASAEGFYAAPGGVQNYWTSLLLNLGMCGGLFIASALIVRHSWQDTGRGSSRERWPKVAGAFFTWRKSRSWRVQMLEGNPFKWLAGRHRTQYGAVVKLLIACFLFAYPVSLVEQDWWAEPELLMVLAFWLHLWLKLLVAMAACRGLGEDRRSGALELVLSTPLTVPQIIAGQVQALARQFGWVLALVLVFDLIVALGMISHVSFERALWLKIWFLGVLLLLVDLLAMAWLGMWLGFAGRKFAWAVFRTIATILVLPWLLTILLVSLEPQSIRSEVSFLLVFALISLSVSMFFFLYARQQLLTRFRPMATRNSGPASEENVSGWPQVPAVEQGACVKL